MKCECNGCGGYGAFKEQQRLEMVAKRERFEQWLAEREQDRLADRDDERVANAIKSAGRTER